MGKFSCPNCNGTQIPVDKTSTKPEGVVRLRICTSCRLRIETTESIDMVYDPVGKGDYAHRLTPQRYMEHKRKIEILRRKH
jgi:transcriptional regulator NrdR family protein